MQPVGTGPQLWVIAACAVAIALGTYSGGWRIIKTMGRGITEVEPGQGFAAESATTATILASSHLGFALSTTQVAAGSVIGSGLGRKGATVRWRTAGRIAIGWLITIPSSAVIGAIAALLTTLGPWGIAADVLLAVAAIVGIYLWSRRTRVDHTHMEVNLAQPAPGQFVRPKRRRKARA